MSSLLKLKWLSGLFGPRQKVQTVSAEELRQKVASPDAPFLLDVRSKEEFNFHGHIAGSMLIPLRELPDRLAELSPEQPTVVICRSGMRSKRACKTLMKHGFIDVANLSGGTHRWERFGFPVERGPVL